MMADFSAMRTDNLKIMRFVLFLVFGFCALSSQPAAAQNKIHPTCVIIKKIIDTNIREAQRLIKKNQHPKWCLYYLAKVYDKRGNKDKAKVII